MPSKARTTGKANKEEEEEEEDRKYEFQQSNLTTKPTSSVH